MTIAQKKLKQIFKSEGIESVMSKTGIGMNSLYAYAKSTERAMSMKMSSAKKFFHVYGIEPREWWEVG